MRSIHPLVEKKSNLAVQIEPLHNFPAIHFLSLVYFYILIPTFIF